MATSLSLGEIPPAMLQQENAALKHQLATLRGEVQPSPFQQENAALQQQVALLRKEFLKTNIENFKLQDLHDHGEMISHDREAGVAAAVELGKKNWFGKPSFLQGKGTLIRHSLASPFSKGALVTLLTTPAWAFLGSRSVRAEPPVALLLAATPALAGIFSYIGQHKTNENVAFWMRKLGVNASWGDVAHHPVSQKERDRAIQLQSSREFGMGNQMGVLNPMAPLPLNGAYSNSRNTNPLLHAVNAPLGMRF